MNCANADVEDSGLLLSKDRQDLLRNQLSEFLF